MGHPDRMEIGFARMIIIWRLKTAGYLKGKSLQFTANLFGVHRSTIMRDLRRISNAERILPDLQSRIKLLPIKGRPRRYKSDQTRS